MVHERKLKRPFSPGQPGISWLLMLPLVLLSTVLLAVTTILVRNRRWRWFLYAAGALVVVAVVMGTYAERLFQLEKWKGDDDVMEMRVSGKVQDGNLIMYDKATDSEWLQESGEALSGEQKGARLTELDETKRTLNVRWDVWSKDHPDSLVLFCDHCETEHSK